MKFSGGSIKIEWLDACQGSLHTFEAVFKISQILF